MQNSLKNKLKFDYENLHEIPSEGLWERLENKLEDKKEMPKPTFGFWRYAAIFLLLVSVLSMFLYKNNERIIVEPIVKIQPKSIQNSIIKTENQDVAKWENSKVENNIQTKKNESIHNKIPEKKLVSENISTSKNKEILNNRIETHLRQILPTEEENSLPKIENKEVIADVKSEKLPVKYVKSEDLLFGRELEKASLEQEKDNSKLGKTDLRLQKVKSIEILGFTVYSEEKK